MGATSGAGTSYSFERVRFLEILKQNGKVFWTSLTTICSKGIFQHDIATPLQLNELRFGPFLIHDLLLYLYLEKYDGSHQWIRHFLLFRSTSSHPWFLVEFVFLDIYYSVYSFGDWCLSLLF
jgi:hypothetical protein